MISRFLLCAVFICSLAGCDNPDALKKPYHKKDEEDRKMRDQSGDQNFTGFVGRLRIAVSKHDRAMIASMMTQDFGYRWDAAPPGETPFSYWDQHALWDNLADVLKQKFAVNGKYMMAPAAAANDPNFSGLRVGIQTVNGSWKFAYFVGDEPR